MERIEDNFNRNDSENDKENCSTNFSNKITKHASLTTTKTKAQHETNNILTKETTFCMDNTMHMLSNANSLKIDKQNISSKIVSKTKRINVLQRKSFSKSNEIQRRNSITLKVNPLKMIVNTTTAKKSTNSNKASKSPFTKPTDTFRCEQCNKTFLLETTLNAHKKKIHMNDILACVYCKRKFQKPIGLSKHLRENCAEIPVNEKKKLLDKDYALMLNRNKEKERKIDENYMLTPSKSGPLMDLFIKSLPKLDIPTKVFLPITGIHRTPNKVIRCTICNAKFLDPLTFAEHNVLHSDSNIKIDSP